MTVTAQSSTFSDTRILTPPGSTSTTFDLVAGNYTLTVVQGGIHIPPSPLTPVFVTDGVFIPITFSDGSGLSIFVIINGVPPPPTPPPSGCIVADAVVGGPVMLEGDVVTGSSGAFRLRTGRASGDVDVDAVDALYRCLVPVAACPPSGSLSGAKVHVKGRLQSCTGLSAQVVASEVKLKKLP